MIEQSSLSSSRAWPVKEAVKVIKRAKELNRSIVTFETGYGPSGLPHLGTICEVIRTSMVKKAYDQLNPSVPSRLIAFVDDLDGFRKVPNNVPNQEELTEHIGKPLINVPDPFNEQPSFGDYNAKRFEYLLEQYGYKADIKKASQEYKSGRFNSALIEVLKYHKSILAIMREHLRDERWATYSPFLPISQTTGKVLQVAVEYKPSTIVYQENGTEYEIPVVDGFCKLQWKPDLGMRWHALGVDYELYGKDLNSSIDIASKVCKVLGSVPPLGFQYEHFLAPDGGRISKSKGNESVRLQDWLAYAPKGTLEHFVFQNPDRAKCLRMEDMPNYVEAFLNELKLYHCEEINKCESAIYFLDFIPSSTPISFKLALSIASAMHASSWQQVAEKMQLDSKDTFGKEIIECAFKFFNDQIKASMRVEPVPFQMHDAVKTLITKLKAANNNQDDKDITTSFQDCFFSSAKEHNISISQWFTALYKSIIGTSQGPKLGTFCLQYGIEPVIQALEKSIKI